MTKKKITKDTPLNEVVEINKSAREILFDEGLHCIGCPMSEAETLEEGCFSHGMSQKDVEDLVKKINETK